MAFLSNYAVKTALYSIQKSTSLTYLFLTIFLNGFLMTEICKFLNLSHSNFKLVTFTEETPNGKLHFLRSAMRTIFFKK